MVNCRWNDVGGGGYWRGRIGLRNVPMRLPAVPAANVSSVRSTRFSPRSYSSAAEHHCLVRHGRATPTQVIAFDDGMPV